MKDTPQPKTPVAAEKLPALKYIDIFSGCGGLSVGLHLAGWKGLFAVERDADAFASLKANLIDDKKHFDWPEWLPQRNWNINILLRNKSPNLIGLQGTVDLVVGGPPCQGFSMNGRRKKSDKRNQLVHSYLKFVELVQPRAILFENVRGFTIKFDSKEEDGMDYSELVLEELKKLGYNDAHGEIVDMADFGVPQRRNRFIVIATRNNSAGKIFSQLKEIKDKFLSDKGIPKKNTVKEAISDLEKKHGLIPCPDKKGFNSGIRAVSTTGLQKHLALDPENRHPDSHRFVNHTQESQIVFGKLLAAGSRNQKIGGEERKKYGLKKRSVVILDPNEVAPTITTIPDDFIHYSEPRVMTVRECARIQSFPDWFKFKGPYTSGGKRRARQTPRYTQVGNAVPPLFAELAGQSLKSILGE